jgi:hypothetical protein
MSEKGERMKVRRYYKPILAGLRGFVRRGWKKDEVGRIFFAEHT